MAHSRILSRFHLFPLGLLVAITAAAFYKIPAETGLPVHWGFDGRPDRIWPRNLALLVFPAVAVIVTALFAAIGQFVPAERIEPGRHVSEAALTGILGLCCALQFALILIGVGSEIDLVRIIAFLLAAFWIGLGVVLSGAPPNAYAGVRLPWHTKDAAAWRANHRVTGGLMVVGGLGLGLLAWLNPEPAGLMIGIGVALFAPVILGGLFSLVRSRM